MLSLNIFLLNARSFAELAPVIRQVREDISFFGYRYVYAPGYGDYLHIDTLATRISSLAYATIEFTADERAFGYEIEDIINRLYRDNDSRKEHMNIFSRILCDIRDFWNAYIASGGSIGDRRMWELDTESNSELFGYYTMEQYEMRFGHAPSTPGRLARQDSPTLIWGPFSRQTVGA